MSTATVNLPLLTLAQANASPLTNLLPFAGVFVIIYFLLLRPQQKQAKEHKALLSALKKGDEIVTQGGILGRIHVITDKVVILEIANGVKMRILKTSIQGRASGLEDASIVAKVSTDEGKEQK